MFSIKENKKGSNAGFGRAPKIQGRSVHQLFLYRSGHGLVIFTKITYKKTTIESAFTVQICRTDINIAYELNGAKYTAYK